MKKARIRPLALVVFRRGARVFVQESRDSVKAHTFYRPLGGGIDFGERAEDAARREIREELGTDITNLRLLDVVENLFTFEGRPGHEIIYLFEADFVDESVYSRESIECELQPGEPIRACWKEIAFFDRGEAPLYPEGLLALLRGAS